MGERGYTRYREIVTHRERERGSVKYQIQATIFVETKTLVVFSLYID